MTSVQYSNHQIPSVGVNEGTYSFKLSLGNRAPARFWQCAVIQDRHPSTRMILDLKTCQIIPLENFALHFHMGASFFKGHVRDAETWDRQKWPSLGRVHYWERVELSPPLATEKKVLSNESMNKGKTDAQLLQRAEKQQREVCQPQCKPKASKDKSNT